MSDSFKDQSRRDWMTANNSTITTEQLKLGCMQRIADATEAMAKNYNTLLADKERLTKRNADLIAETQRMARSIYALRGVVTRMKKARRAS